MLTIVYKENLFSQDLRPGDLYGNYYNYYVCLLSSNSKIRTNLWCIITNVDITNIKLYSFHQKESMLWGSNFYLRQISGFYIRDSKIFLDASTKEHDVGNRLRFEAPVRP